MSVRPEIVGLIQSMSLRGYLESVTVSRLESIRDEVAQLRQDIEAQRIAREQSRGAISAVLDDMNARIDNMARILDNSQ
jgi:hypothetical protein